MWFLFSGAGTGQDRDSRFKVNKVSPHPLWIAIQNVILFRAKDRNRGALGSCEMVLVVCKRAKHMSGQGSSVRWKEGGDMRGRVCERAFSLRDDRGRRRRRGGVISCTALMINKQNTGEQRRVNRWRWEVHPLPYILTPSLTYSLACIPGTLLHFGLVCQNGQAVSLLHLFLNGWTIGWTLLHPYPMLSYCLFFCFIIIVVFVFFPNGLRKTFPMGTLSISLSNKLLTDRPCTLFTLECEVVVPGKMQVRLLFVFFLIDEKREISWDTRVWERKWQRERES